jgi:hypothetical protein
MTFSKRLTPRTGACLVHRRRHSRANPRRAKLIKFIDHTFHNHNSSRNRTCRGGNPLRSRVRCGYTSAFHEAHPCESPRLLRRRVHGY